VRPARPSLQARLEEIILLHRWNTTRGRQVPGRTDHEQRIRIAPLPSLYRQGQIQRANLYEADVAALLLATHVDPEPLLEQLSAHVSASDLRELRGILIEMERRRDRFRPKP
jgi:hypothetical protein